LRTYRRQHDELGVVVIVVIIRVNFLRRPAVSVSLGVLWVNSDDDRLVLLISCQTRFPEFPAVTRLLKAAERSRHVKYVVAVG
jgi:hypothetical protein